MRKNNNIISAVCKRRLHIQGYQNYSDNELNNFKYGIRFAYATCAALVALGLILNNTLVLKIIAVIALAGIFPPYHPFDYLYNYAIRRLFHQPKIPPRTNQGRFACGIAFVWLTITIILLDLHYIPAGHIFGMALLSVATLVSTTDICIPSMIYNFLFGKARKP